MTWLAAFECEPAGDVMAWRAYKDEGLTPQAAQDKLRRGILDAVKSFLKQHSLSQPQVGAKAGLWGGGLGLRPCGSQLRGSACMIAWSAAGPAACVCLVLLSLSADEAGR